MRLEVKNLSYSYADSKVADNVCLHVDAGEFVGIIGPNGSGKSTVLKNIYRALIPDDGKIYLDGEELLAMPYKKSALKMAVVGQENEVPFDFAVEEIVSMGRFPHKKLFDVYTSADREIVYGALARLGLEKIANRDYRSLSGGEKQRVLIARAIAQQSDFFILDEPTNHLDIGYQLQIFGLIKRLNVTVLSAIHDLNMAALYCDRIYVLKGGKVALEGTPEEVLTPENIYDIYCVRAAVENHPITGKLSITYIPT